MKPHFNETNALTGWVIDQPVSIFELGRKMRSNGTLVQETFVICDKGDNRPHAFITRQEGEIELGVYESVDIELGKKHNKIIKLGNKLNNSYTYTHL